MNDRSSPSEADEVRISVITPVYNGAKYLQATLDSLRRQTLSGFEHILVDDGSTDATPEIISQYFMSERAHTVRAIRQENCGESSAVNRGCREANGEYVLVLNADDLIDPRALEVLSSVLDQHPHYVAAYPNWCVIDATGAVIKRHEPIDYCQQTLVGDFACLPGPGTLFRRRSIGPGVPLRDVTFRLVSDYEFWMRLSLKGSFVRVPETLAFWRSHPQSGTYRSRGPEFAEEMLRVRDQFFQRDDLPPSVVAWERQSFAMSRYTAALEKLHDRDVPGRRLMLQSLKTVFLRKSECPPRRRRLLLVLAVFLSPLSSKVASRLGLLRAE